MKIKIILVTLALMFPACSSRHIDSTETGTSAQGFGSKNQPPDVGNPRPAAQTSQ